jgi:hypothetical protein
MYRDCMNSFAEYLSCEAQVHSNAQLWSTVTRILDGSGARVHSYPYLSLCIIMCGTFVAATKAALFPFLLSHAQSLWPLVGPVKKLLQTSHLSAPASWYALY